MNNSLEWFAIRGHWVIRKMPDTKDKYYVACGFPPAHVLKVYGVIV